MAKKYVTITTLTHTVTPGVAKTPTTAAKRPVTKEIGPGTVILLDDDDQAQELIDLGAIRKANTDDTKEVKAERLDELSEEQLQAASIEAARHARELDDERARREREASTGLGETGNGAGGKSTAKSDAATTKTATKTTAKAAGKPAANKAAGKPAESAADAGDDKNGDAGPAGQGGNADGQGTNEGANTAADADDNAAGADDGGLV